MDIRERVTNDLAGQLSGKSGSAADLRHEIEQLAPVYELTATIEIVESFL